MAWGVDDVGDSECGPCGEGSLHESAAPAAVEGSTC